MHRGSDLPVVAATCALLIFGCKAFDEARLVTDAGETPRCPGRQPPPRPSVDDGASVDSLTVVLGNPVLDQRDRRWADIGYNLDGLCSDGSEDTIECRAPALSAPPAMDGNEGIDNAFGDAILTLIFVARPDFEERALTGYSRGLGAIMLRIDEWNGEPDDPSVRVAIIQTIFGSGEMLGDFSTIEIGDTALLVDGVAHSYPQWSGEDYYWGRPDNFLLGDVTSPRLVVDDAYVADGTLVIVIPGRIPLILGGNETDVLITLSSPIFTVELGADGRSTGRSILAGRWAVPDVLAALPPAGVCAGTEDYQSFERLLELAVDIPAMPDETDTATCGAISVGLEFQPGVAATLVDAVMPFPTPMPCATTDAGSADGGVDAGAP